MNSNFTSMSSFIPQHKTEKVECPVCGKMFQPAPEHSYKIGKGKNKLVCTYTCMRKWEKGEVKKLFPQAKRDRKRNKHGAVRIVETGKTFESINKCAEHLYTSNQSVYQAIVTGCRCCSFHIEEIKEGDTE